MEDNNNIKKLVTAVFPKREHYIIQGQHPDLSKFKAWYAGTTDFHVRQKIINGEYKRYVLESSGLAKQLCEAWAGSFMNEAAEITVPEDNQDDIITDILAKQFLPYVNNFADKYFGLGIGASVVMPSSIQYNTKTNAIVQNEKNSVKISLLDATRIVPITIDDNRVTEVAFIRYSTNEVTIQAHLIDDDGKYLIAEAKGKLKESAKDFTIDSATIKKWKTNTTEPLFQIWYPVVVDNKHLENTLGTSCFANSIAWIKAFDEALDKFYVEFKNGGTTKYISSDLTYIDEATGEVKAVALSEDTVYLPPSKVGETNNQQNAYQPQIRSDQFIRGMSFLANMAGKNAGLGDSAFEIDGMGGRPLQTATAAVLKDREAKRNVRKNENLAQENIRQMLMAIKYVYNSFVKDVLTYEHDDIQVVFEDNIIEDTTSMKEAERAEVAAGIRTIAEYRSHWFDEDIDSAQEFVQLHGLLAEKYMPTLQGGGMTVEQYVDIVYGENAPNHNEIVAELKEKASAGQSFPMLDENDTEEEEQEEDDE